MSELTAVRCVLAVKDLVPRVLAAGKMNYWEAGMDMNYGDDLYDSFVAYQGELIHQLRNLTHTKGEATGHEQTANDLLQAALDIERADLREAD